MDSPPPVDCELYFNDLYFIKYSKNKIIDLTVHTNEVFYSDCLQDLKIYKKQMMKKMIHYQNILVITTLLNDKALT